VNQPAFMLLIFSPVKNSRLGYIFQIALDKLLGLSWSWTTDQDEFLAFEGPKLAYAKEPLDGGLFLEASGLLFEQNIIPRDLKVKIFKNAPVLFFSENPASSLPFDPFAAAFYMIARYEEYIPHHTDRYGRFPATESIAWKGKFLERPIVHEWIKFLGDLLQQHFPELHLGSGEYRYLSTIDIDHVYAYRCRPPIRTLGGVGRALGHGRFREIIQRLQVLSGRLPDPYDNYDYIHRVNEPYGNKALYFILFADYGGNDNNIPVTSKSFKHLLSELDRDKNVGIHPSFSSHSHPGRLESEYIGLSEALHRKVTRSRQHFLKISFPTTYRKLIALGIREDFSMSYASHIGFRAGITIPFPFFDLTRNEITPLIIHPVSIMDVTLKDYLRLTPEKSIEKIEDLINVIKPIQGEFVSLWHNESLGDSGRWKGWRQVYETMIRMASS